ncbi:MAG: hypothetical protein H6867_01430 [Rhodospirillales bacterium]|nr:hypothetical protein [Rhodospirillales bacterium]MCB9997178.1 hypothetical protein [Rhodospirillales bacterium]
MSLPIRYSFYQITQDGAPVDINIANRGDPTYKASLLAACWSDRFTMIHPSTDMAIKQEALTALLKLARFVEERTIPFEEAQKVNAVGINGIIASFNELADALASEEIKPVKYNEEKFGQLFPQLSAKP